MSDEPITNPPTESPAPVDALPPTPVTPTEAPPIETPSVPVPVVTPPVPAPAPAPAAPAVPDVRSLLAKALAKIQFRKQAKLEKIMVLARERGQVANDDVQPADSAGGCHGHAVSLGTSQSRAAPADRC